MSRETCEKRKNPIQLHFTDIYMPLSRNLEQTNFFKFEVDDLYFQTNQTLQIILFLP